MTWVLVGLFFMFATFQQVLRDYGSIERLITHGGFQRFLTVQRMVAFGWIVFLFGWMALLT